MKKLIEAFESIPATAVGFVFLVLSFVLPKFSVNLTVDPAWVTIIISGLPILYSAIRKLIVNSGISKISSSLLISMAMAAAVAIGDIFAAGEVAFIMAVGEILEDLTTGRAKKGLKNLIALAPSQGRKVVDGKEITVSADEIRAGDILRVFPGESIPADGVIISGETSVDQSVVTGESLPVDKKTGDEVYCATVNRFGAIDIRATKVGENSSLQKLIRLVREAENKKAHTARVADKAASWLVPLALLIAVVTGIATKDISRAVTVLVVFCPCALVLATPTAIMAAIGQATKHGVIIKSGEALEKMGKVDTVTFDKTGTLTYGKLEVSDFVCFGCDERTLLSLAASAESRSEHPLGKAIVDYAKKKETDVLQCEDFSMAVGRGVSATVNGNKVVCANSDYMSENSIEIPSAVSRTLDELRAQGKATVIVAVNGRCEGIIALSDVIRPDAHSVIEKLRAVNTRAVLLTGDSGLSAEYFASKAGIEQVESELLPEQKVEKIASIRNQNKVVCMIGDGVNDAPALKSADVGIAMGSMGSDIAVDAADIALMSDDISKIPYLKRLSIATVKTIKFSIALAMIINVVAVILSVAGLLNPTTGALVHNAGSVFVVFIAAMLYDRKFKE
ncbi:MAG: cation-translocating P-type ATPase [Clostridia bacterium]|nr:cation-translocating P-type ATPase [Clostridia bacterium]